MPQGAIGSLFGEILGPLGVLMGAPGRSRAILDTLGGFLGRSWLAFGSFLGTPGHPGDAVGRFEGRFGALLGALGALLGCAGGDHGGAVGRPWDHFEHLEVGVVC